MDGKVERLSFATDGMHAQQAVLDALVRKFGKPRSTERRPMQNLMGAQFVSIVADWAADSYTVEFEGIEHSLDTGRVNVKSRAWHEAAQRSYKRLKGNRPTM
jgi:hypothetical protein